MLALVFVLGCQRQTPPPPLAHDEVWESCRNAGLDVHNLRAADLKIFIDCLSGKSRSLEPLASWLNSVSEAELDQVLNPFREAVKARPETLELMAGWLWTVSSNTEGEARGSDESGPNSLSALDSVLANLRVLIETGWVQSSVQMFLPLVDSTETVDPSHLTSYLIGLFDKMVLEKRLYHNLHRVTQFQFSSRAQSFAERMKSAMGEVSSESFSPDTTRAIRNWISDNSAHQVLFVLSDPGLLTSLQWKNPEDRADIAAYIYSIVQDPGLDSNLLENLVRMYNATNRSLICLSGQAPGRFIPNLFDTAARRILTHWPNRDALNLFLLRDSSLLLSAAAQYCEMDNAIRTDLGRSQFAWSRIAEVGGGPGAALVLQSMYRGNNNPYFRNVFGSRHLLPLQSAFYEFTRRGFAELFLEILANDLDAQRLSEISDLFREASLGDLPVSSMTPSWKSIVGDELVSQLESACSVSRRTQLSWTQLVRELDLGHPSLSAAVRTRIFESLPGQAPMAKVKPGLEKLFAGDVEGIRLWSNWLSSWNRLLANSSGGLMGFIESFYRAGVVTEVTPFLDVWKTGLKTPLEASERGKVWLKLFRSSQFTPAVEQLGQLIESGELKRLIRFLATILREAKASQAGTPATSVPKLSSSPVVPPWRPGGVRNVPLEGDTGAVCRQINGPLFGGNGENFGRVLRCLDTRATPYFHRVANILEQNGLLSEVVDFLSGTFASPKGSARLMNWMDELNQKAVGVGSSASTELDRWFSAIANLSSLQVQPSGVRGSELIDPFVRFLKRLPGDDRASVADALGSLLKDDGFEAVANATLEIGLAPVNFQGDLQAPYLMPLYDREPHLRRKARSLLPHLSEQEFERRFRLALDQFRKRGDDYLDSQGVYPRISDQELTEALRSSLADLLRSTNLEELRQTFEDFREGRRVVNRAEYVDVAGQDFTQFIQELVTGRDVVLYRTGAGREPVLRVVTPLDQFELLALNSDFALAPDFPFGADHVGLSFQIRLSESRDLVRTVAEFKAQMRLALDVWFQIMDTELRHHFENFQDNFYLIENAAASGRLRLFQRLYQGFYRSTPLQLRRVQDVKQNELAIAHKPMKYGLLARLVPTLNQLHDQGRLRPVLREFLELSRWLPASQSNNLRGAVNDLVRPSVLGAPSLLSGTLEKLFTYTPDQKAKVLSRLVDLQSLLVRWQPQPEVVLKMPEVATSKSAAGLKLVNGFFESLSSESSFLAGTVRRFATSNVNAWRPWADRFFTPQNNTNSLVVNAPVLSLFRMLLEFETQDPVLRGQVEQLLKIWLPSLQPAPTDEQWRRWVRMLSSSRAGDGLLADVLTNEKRREQFWVISQTLAEQGGWAQLIDGFSERLRMGVIREQLDWLFYEAPQIGNTRARP